MDSGRQPPDAKPEARAGGASAETGVAAAPGGLRKYPTPPGLVVRMILLCLKPEAWAAAARYPSRFTMIPLGLAVVIAALAVGVSDGVRFERALTAFAPSFPAMEVSSDGVLKAKGELANPVRFTYFPMRFVVDPSNKAMLNSSNESYKTILITDREIVLPGLNEGDVRYPLAALGRMGYPLPEKGKTAVVDSAAIRGVAGQLGASIGMAFGMVQLVGDGLWALLMMFFLVPLITLAASMGARSFVLPKRAAYRMAAGLLVPLILFNAVMHAAGYSLVTSVGPDVGMLIWFFGAAGLALWTGVMARQMYGPMPRGARRG